MELSLRGWLNILENSGRLKKIKKTVDSCFEIAAIGKKLSPDYAVFFENVLGSKAPVITGLASTREMFAESIGMTVSEMMTRFAKALDAPSACEIIPANDVAVKEVIYQGSEIDLEKILPSCIHHELDGGKYLTAAMLITRDPETGIRNVSIHRHQIHGTNRLGALLLPRHTLNIFERMEKKGKSLDIALVIGCHPALLLASQATTRLGVDEFEIASALVGSPVKMVKCETIDLEVPLECEYVLEGRLLPNIKEPEGPFGEYPKTYGSKSRKHVIEISCVTHRKEPIYHTIIPATMEHLLLGAIPREAVLHQIIKQAVPTVMNVHLTPSGGCRYHCVIQIEKRNEGEAKNAIFAAFASSAEIKHVVVVDMDIDPFDLADVEWAIATRCQAGRDVFIIQNAMGNRLDPSSSNGLCDKMGIDATIPIADEDQYKYRKIVIPGIDTIDLDQYFT